jgi:ribulose-5-phosphate 4-epimerase/fuculose-1-phosphate aldolase
MNPLPLAGWPIDDWLTKHRSLLPSFPPPLPPSRSTHPPPLPPPQKVIHSAFYEARPDVHAVMHNHSRACMGVSCLSDGLEYLTQDGAGFFGKVSYHGWEGLSDDAEEKANLAWNLGPAPKHTLIMRSHGAAVVGGSVGQAWVRNYYLDRICQVQMDLLPAIAKDTELRTGSRRLGDRLIVYPAKHVLRHAAKQIDQDFSHGKFEWAALLREAKRLELERRSA